MRWTSQIKIKSIRDILMKKTLLATVIAATFLAGCSSNSSKNDGSNPDEKVGIADVIYNEELRSAAIIGDEGNNALIIADGNGNAAITVNGQAYAVHGDVIVNDQGDIVGTLMIENGAAIAVIDETAYTLTVVDGRLVVEGADIIPDFGDTPRWSPEFGEDDWGPEGAPTYGDIIEAGGAVIIKGDNENFVTIKADGEGNAAIAINGGEQTYLVQDGELFNYQTNESIGHIQKEGGNYTVRLDDGTEVVFRNEDGRLFAAVISRPDASHPIINDPRPETTPPTYGDIVNAGGAIIINGDNDNFVTIKADDQGNAAILINGGEMAYTVINGELVNYATGESLGHIQKDDENYIVRLDDGTEVVFRNEDGRLFAAVTSRPDIGSPIEPVYDADRDFTGTNISVDDGTVTIKIGEQSITITNTAAGAIVTGTDGSKATIDRNTTQQWLTLVEQAESIEAKETLVKQFVLFNAASVVDWEGRNLMWSQTIEANKEWAKVNPLLFIEVVILGDAGFGDNAYNLGYFLVTGKKIPTMDLKDIVKENKLTNAQKTQLKDRVKSISAEQRQQIKQAIKTKLQARS